MFYNFVPIYLSRRFFQSEAEIGLTLGAFGLAMALVHLPAGHLADKLGRRPLLIIAWTLGLIATLIMGLAQSLPIFLMGLIGYGLTAFVSSPLNSYVTAARGRWEVGTALALTTATFSLGMALGPVTGGWIGERYGMQTSFLIAFGIFVISNGFIWLIEKQPLDQHDPSAPPLGLRSNRGLIIFTGVFAFAIFSMYLPQPLTPNFLTKVRELSLAQTGFVFTIGALGNSLIALAFSRLNPRWGFLCAQVLVILFATAMWRGSALPILALGYFLLGGFRAGRPMAMAQARGLVHPSQMGKTYGALETVNALAIIIAPPIAGWLFEIDPLIIYPTSIGLLALSIGIGYVFSPARRTADL
ncbi:MAG: MFS transporter [Anaerolineales bacterium]|nr:MFS transporter [Anaerolineales bacterium]